MFSMSTVAMQVHANTNSGGATEKRFVNTVMGKIAVFIKHNNSGRTPVILLHGVYLDHHLWDAQVADINDRTVVTIDMPMHGESIEGVPTHWTLADGATMLIQILDSLKMPHVIAVGHSWGSMTILRAVHQQSDRFAFAGFCNMPFEAATNGVRFKFAMQHSMVWARNFYMKQAAKALFGKRTLAENRDMVQQLIRPMSKLSGRAIRKIDRIVIMNADDATELVRTLPVPARALKGEEDYVPTPPRLQLTVVRGGHISPVEAADDVTAFIKSSFTTDTL